MSVSARTFQLLYIIRQRMGLNQSTKLADFSEFIADRRKTAPALYGNAYISPSALQDLLGRMTIENLVTPNDGGYQLEHMGSQMADLLTGIDACTTGFIENYKEMVVKAALEQRARLGQGPANQREIAAVTNISLDSARRGLETLVKDGTVIENSTGRSQTYTLATPPMTAIPSIMDTQEVVIAEVQANIAAQDAQDDIKKALSSIDDSDAPIPLSAVLQDDGPDVEPAAVVTQDETTEAPEECTSCAAQVAPENEHPAGEEDGEEDFLLEDQGEGEPLILEYSWDSVPMQVRDAIFIQAEAAGMTLPQFLLSVVETNQRRIRRAINGADEHVMRTQMSEILNLQRINANLKFKAQAKN